MNSLIVIFLMLNSFTPSSPLKVIQFVPGFSNSHVLFNYRLAESLISRGHNVTLWTAISPLMIRPSIKPPERSQEVRFEISMSEEGMKALQDIAFKKYSVTDMIKVGKHFRQIWSEACDMQLEMIYHFMKEPTNLDFDVAIMHYLDVCPIAVTHILGIKKQAWLSAGIYIFDFPASHMGFPQNPSYIPNALSAYSDRMSFMQRVNNFGMYALFTLYAHFFPNLYYDEEAVFHETPDEERPSLLDLCDEVEGFFINGDQAIDFPRPLPYGVTFTGEMKPKKKDNATKSGLSQKWLDLVEQAEKGVVVFSLGSVVNTTKMPQRMIEAFAGGFKTFPEYTFLWKIDVDIPSIVNDKHIVLSRWLPQPDLLNHPKTKAFITHAGYNSLLETTEAAVPVVVMPMFADQYSNAMRAVRHGLGVLLDKETVTSDDVIAALTKVLNEKQFTDNARRLSRMLKDTIIKPEDLMSKQLMRLSSSAWYPTLWRSKKLTFMQYYCLDAMLLLIACASLIMYLIYKVIRSLVNAAGQTKRKN